MRPPHTLTRTLMIAAIAAVGGVSTATAKVDADPNKDYRISARNGPWMIMVATFHRPRVAPDAEDKVDESGARKAAKELVLELRQKGIPAYVFELQKTQEKVRTADRLGRVQERVTMQDDMQISVLAGNYTSVNDKPAISALRYIKKFRPKSFGDRAIFRTYSSKGPLSGAFMTVNPLLSPEEVRDRTIDPEQVKLLKYLNSGNPYAVTECGGEYTLRIKTFKGYSSVRNLGRANKATIGSGGNGDRFRVTDPLNEAKVDANMLCVSLRERGVEAYLWHDRYESFVSVGGFSSKEDPAARALFNRFAAEEQYDPKTGVVQTAFKSEPPGHSSLIRAADMQSGTWFFDAVPQMVRVPKMPK